MNIRLHRGGFEESMTTAAEVEPNLQAVFDYLVGHGYSFVLDVAQVIICPYGGIDPRNGWDTHLFMINGEPLAFTDGDFPLDWDRAKATPSASKKAPEPGSYSVTLTWDECMKYGNAHTPLFRLMDDAAVESVIRTDEGVGSETGWDMELFDLCRENDYAGIYRTIRDRLLRGDLEALDK